MRLGFLGGLWDSRLFSILVSETSKENSQVNVEEALRMNNQRRKQLNNISARIGRIAVPADIDELESIKSEIEDVLWDEQMAFDNMPESLQDSMRGEMSQDAQSNMEDAISRIDDFIADYENEADNEETEDRDQMEKKEAELAQMIEDMIDDVTSSLDEAAM